jgi:hypothetical protein
MKFQESPFVDPKIPRYKIFERKNIEKSLELEFGSKEKRKKIFQDFFGLSIYSGKYFGVGDFSDRNELEVEITEAEIDDFVIFCKFTVKRILNAQSQKEGGVYTELKKLVDLKDFIELPDIFYLLYHDVSHAVGTIITGRNKINNNSIVPPFFEFKPGMSINDKEVIEDELYGALFAELEISHKDNSATKENVILNTLRMSSTFDDFKSIYIQRVMKATQYENEKEARRFRLRGKSFGMTDAEFKSEQEKIIEEIKSNPPQKLIEILQRVWDHRDNPRVLVDLFFKEVGPYIEELKKRTPRKLKKFEESQLPTN